MLLNPPLAVAQAALVEQKKNNQGNGKVVKKQTKDVATRNRPQNQHGIYSVKIREMLEVSSQNSKKEKEIFEECYKIYHFMRNDTLEKHDQERFFTASEAIKTKAHVLLDIKFQLARTHFEAQTGIVPHSNEIANDIVTMDFTQNLDLAIENFINALQDEWNKGTDRFKTWEYRLSFILMHWGQKYFWYCFAKMAATHGYEKLYVHFHSEKERQVHEAVIELKQFTLEAIPPFHPYCGCTLNIDKERSEK